MKKRISLPYTIATVGLCLLAPSLFSTEDLSSLEFSSLGTKPIEQPKYSSYILRINFPATIKKVPALCAYYKGYNLEFDTDFCVFQEERTCDKFIVAITEQVRRTPDNTYLERIAHKPCRLFYLTRIEGTKDHAWRIEEEKEENIPVKLPRTALVLFLNPAHVEGLSCNKKIFKATGIIQDPVVTLPYVTIKSFISEKELETASVNTLLASLDLRSIHPHMPKESKVERSTVISMRTFNN